MKAKKLSKLLLPMATQSWRYYWFEGYHAPQLLLLPLCITNLCGMRLYKNIAKSDVTHTSIEEV